MIAPLALLGGVCMALCQWLIWRYAPIEETLGPVQKIFYFHLPLAWWALCSFFLVFCGSIAYILRRKTGADNFCGAAAEVGLLFCGLALASGMIWAKKSWGVWWTWDPRLATTLVMWFLYSGYLLLRGMDWAAQRKNTICAVFGLMAFLDVPLVFFSARLFRTIHPAVFGGSGSGLDEAMAITAIASVLGMGLLWGALIILRFQQLKTDRKLDALLIDDTGF